ncbi:hypothetical protein [Deinococcus sp. DB0503]|uniref:hypothetical protein n=1 Tax=Deinococcus sp. DB0503 TaxID=2479203 RepID=UPI0018DF7249|nr:hypothetical protein [Deinococcus sp. DB0503]MBI0445353.1 hypothetical protein [Deinococcus sp. DB0503]
MPLNITPICDALSADRLSPYRATTGSDLEALRLYQHNIMLAEALSTPLHVLEVVFRNRFEVFLTHRYSPTWFQDAGFLAILASHDEARQLSKAKAALTQAGKAHTSGRIVAELHFGFWTGLLNRRYRGQFWGPAWHTLLPQQTLIPARPTSGDLSRLEGQVVRDLHMLRRLRNRVSHHEPLWNDPDLWQKHQTLLELLSWMEPEVCAWLAHAQLNRFPGIYQMLKGLQP